MHRTVASHQHAQAGIFFIFWGNLAVFSGVQLVTAGASAPATASSPAPLPARSGSNGPAYDRVADFYGAYIDAVSDRSSGHLDQQLRAFYLTQNLRTRLTAWEAREHADGVLRAQDVPSAWTVTPQDSGMGHTWSTVRLTWGSATHPTYTYLQVQQDLATKKISDIRAKS
ncbi:hypothetical protein AAW14_35635 [Streptomyces hygroscopicus]|uniref:hypothetical protein n=1 Tax=Streptomyces hygroscopicus TaxID=1912 RepID=UPI00223F9C3E|nr:hypothetical protein [Streptomyces hygroscopicus]MCW7947149.1 hypothetical protein [Streptomyces hygroscopicus]